MEIETTNLLNNDVIYIFGKGAILIILIIYTIFSVIIIRQVDLMGKTLITNISHLIKVLAIINTGVVIGLIIFTWGYY